MASISVRIEDRLEGTLNFNTWKDKILHILEEHELDRYISNVLEEPTSNVGCTTFKKNQAKSKWIIYDLVKDKLMPMIIPLKTTREHFNTLTNLSGKKALSQKRELKNKIRNLRDSERFWHDFLQEEGKNESKIASTKE